MRLLTVFVVAFLLQSPCGAAQSGEPWRFSNATARNGVKEYRKAVDAANKVRDAAIRNHQRQLARSLEDALSDERKNDLDEAVKIRDALKRLAAGSGPTLKSSSLRIPPAAVTFDGHHYAVYTTPMTWHVARAHCESLGGHLARIESREEQAFVGSLLKRSALKSFSWIDGTDEQTEGDWLFSTGKPFAYKNWLKSQPEGGEAEHSLAIENTGSNAWHDVQSTKRFPFVCEWGD